MEHLVIRLDTEEWDAFRKVQEVKDSEIYSDNTSPFLQVHYVHGWGNELMDERTFQNLQKELFNF